MSNSVIAGSARNIRAAAAITRTSSASSRAGSFRNPRISGYPFSSWINWQISPSSTGRTRVPASRRSSTSVPPIPTVMTFPNAGSILPPTISSSPFFCCSSTITPSITAVGLNAATPVTIFRNAASAPASSATGRTTPPASLLWTICAEMTFMTTGYPMEPAAAVASSALFATAKRGTGIPYRASIPYPSASPASRPFTYPRSTSVPDKADPDKEFRMQIV